MGRPQGDERDRCIVIHPNLKGAASAARSPSSRLEECAGLALAIDLNVVRSDVLNIARPKPATLLGGGAVENVAKWADDDEYGIDVIIVDTALTPIQQRNLERVWERKVIDRTGLILEIFGARAQTKEGRLQVDLAAQTYQRSRLVRSWTHLERQRGGAGFMGGPGESQIEIDRRLIDQRIVRLKREIRDVTRTRTLHRSARRKVPYPIVALVGYTNAGKSTLFNTLTNSDVMAEDQLFATLDPTMRALDLPSGRSIILSDTVGFVSDLPHELVNAFHATLEEVLEADLIIHVRDCAHPDSLPQRNDVLDVLKTLGVGENADPDTGTGPGKDTDTAPNTNSDKPMIEALNKSDQLDDIGREVVTNRINRAPDPSYLISAITGQGVDTLLAAINDSITAGYETLNVTLEFEDGATLAWLYEHGDVTERNDDTAIELTVRMDSANAERFRQRAQ